MNKVDLQVFRLYMNKSMLRALCVYSGVGTEERRTCPDLNYAFLAWKVVRIPGKGLLFLFVLHILQKRPQINTVSSNV